MSFVLKSELTKRVAGTSHVRGIYFEQNTLQTSAFRNSHRYASDAPLIHECMTELSR